MNKLEQALEAITKARADMLGVLSSASHLQAIVLMPMIGDAAKLEKSIAQLIVAIEDDVNAGVSV